MERSYQIKEYAWKDFFKVLGACMWRACICCVMMALLVGGALLAISEFTRKNQYVASVVKTNQDLDVPVLQSTLKEDILKIVTKKYQDASLTAEQLRKLTNEVFKHLKVEESDGTYQFTLTAFSSSVAQTAQEDLQDVVYTLTQGYKQAYLKKIESYYALPTALIIAEENLLLTLSDMNYYLQTEVLSPYVSSFIEEIESVLNQENEEFARNDFSVYLCEENLLRAQDCLLALENLQLDIAYAQAYICNNGVEKAGTKPMQEYIDGKLLKNPQDEKWLHLQANWNYTQATNAQITQTEGLIAQIIEDINTVLTEYNTITRNFANHILPDYAVFSFFIEDDARRLEIFDVALITAVSVAVTFIICYCVQFKQMDKADQIGTKIK